MQSCVPPWCTQWSAKAEKKMREDLLYVLYKVNHLVQEEQGIPRSRTYTQIRWIKCGMWVAVLLPNTLRGACGKLEGDLHLGLCSIKLPCREPGLFSIKSSIKHTETYYRAARRRKNAAFDSKQRNLIQQNRKKTCQPRLQYKHGQAY